MIRRIIQIDEEKCNGCGACAEACHEGAIGMVNGKATLLRDDYCDGLGDCLPTCPTGAISFVEREAAAYDEKAVQENMRKKAKSNHAAVPHTGCPAVECSVFNIHKKQLLLPGYRQNHSWDNGHAKSNWYRLMHYILTAQNC